MAPCDPTDPSELVTGPDRGVGGKLISVRRAALTWSLLALICASGALVVVVLGTRLTFFNDDWYFLLQRPGLSAHPGIDSLLEPHNGHLVVVLAATYKALVGLFGLGSQLPFRIVLGATVAAVGVSVYVLVSARLGWVAGLVAATVVVFMGPAWEDLLFFSAIAEFGALAIGLAALFVLERDTPRRNAVACVLLVGSVLTFSSGLAFLAGAALKIALRRRPSQLWIVVIPAALWGLWWAFYGSHGPSYVSAANLEHLPRYVIDAASAGVASAAGLTHGSVGTTYQRAHVLMIILGLAATVWVTKGGRPSRGVLVFLATALTFWLLTGASYIPGRDPISSRYQLFDATLLLLTAAELLRDARLGRRATAVLIVAGLAVTISNASVLRTGFKFMSDHADYAKADLGALELARGVAPANLDLVPTVARDPYLSGVTAGRYFAETRVHGSPPVYAPAQLATAPLGERQAADSVLAAAYGVAPRQIARTGSVARCPKLRIGARGEVAELLLPAGGATLSNLGPSPLVIGVRRFAALSRPTYVGFLAGRSSVRLRIPQDRVPTPWYVVARDPVPTATVIAVCPG